MLYLAVRGWFTGKLIRNTTDAYHLFHLDLRIKTMKMENILPKWWLLEVVKWQVTIALFEFNMKPGICLSQRRVIEREHKIWMPHMYVWKGTQFRPHIDVSESVCYNTYLYFQWPSRFRRYSWRLEYSSLSGNWNVFLLRSLSSN